MKTLFDTGTNTLSSEAVEESRLSPVGRTKLVPRPYQVEDFEESFRLWDEGHIGTLSRLFTGAGKTLCACMKFERWRKRGRRSKCLVISYEKQLVWQFSQEIEDIMGVKPGIEMQDERCTPGDIPDIVVASRQTLMRQKLVTAEQLEALDDYGVIPGARLLSRSSAKRALTRLQNDEIECATVDDEIDQFQEHWSCDHDTQSISRLHKFDPDDDWLVCYDEAHKYKLGLVTVGHIVEWFKRNKNHRGFGMTATPRRSDGVSIEAMFPKVSVDMSLAAGIKQGWSVPMRQKFVRIEGIDFADIKKLAGFSQSKWDAEIAERLESQLATFLVPTLDLTGDGMRTLAFFPSVRLVKEAVEFVNTRKPGSAVGVWGELPPRERQQIYRKHKEGLVQYLFACGLCRESYNDQAIMCVGIFRPVSKEAISLSEQMKGRGCRVLPGVVDGLETADERLAAIAASNKSSVMIIDLVGTGGLAECASTIQIYAEGCSDEVIERAEQISLDDGLPPEDCIEKAERDLEEERKQAAERREHEQQERQEYARLRSQAGVNVDYSVHDVGAAVRDSDVGREKPPATARQRRCLWALGFKDNREFEFTMGQAGRMIDQLRRKMTVAEMKYKSGLSAAVATAPTESGRVYEGWF